LIGGFSGLRGDAGARYTWAVELWLEASSAPATVTPAAAASPAVTPASPPGAGLPQAARMAFDRYKADPKTWSFKSFAADRVSGVWGRAWGLQSAAAAMDRALDECRKRSAGCEVYAVGDTVLDEVSPEQRAAILLGGAHLNFTGVLTTEHGGRVGTSTASVYLHRGLTEITGSLTVEALGVSGLITGAVSDTLQATVKLTQSRPCQTEFAGAISIGDGGKTLSASYEGPGCEGLPLKATFTGTRQ
jgi:hypothetical protein